MYRMSFVVLALFFLGCLLCQVYLIYAVSGQLHEVSGQLKLMGIKQDLNQIMDLEASLPCAPAFELSCGIADYDGASGLFIDGRNKVFKYSGEGVDLGYVRCYLESGREILPE